jgi:hypothetical protein
MDLRRLSTRKDRMYSTCLFCQSDLGANESIESFPVGRRLAFDAARGRLWVVCRNCERWNLTPVEERWEAVEECERMFTSTRLRVSTDNIGLSRTRDGLELVRIGRPQRPELAAWRYGDQFGRRRKRYILITSSLVVAGAGLAAGGLATGVVAGGGYGMFQLVNAVQRGIRDRIVRTRVAVPGKELPAVLLGRDMKRIVIGSEDQNWTLRFPYHSDRWGKTSSTKVVLTGEEALRAASSILPAVNVKGATRAEVDNAVSILEQTPETVRLFSDAAKHVAVRRTARKDRRRRPPIMVGSEAFLDRLPATLSLALEMAAHEDIERRAMEGELAILEQAWKEAEEIAAISDSLLESPEVDEKIASLKAGAAR